MKFCGNTDIGKTRDNNEDDYCLLCNDRGDWLGVVCDGIGGCMAGEVASHIATKTMLELFRKMPEMKSDREVNEWLHQSLHAANRKIYLKGKTSRKMQGMGTTAVGFLITKVGTFIFNVGDSRLYACYEDGFIQMSEDHSLVMRLVKEGKITEEEAKVHPQRNTLLNALGVWKTFRIDVNKIDPNYQYLLVCSDGLHGYVDEEKIANIVQSQMLTLDQKVDVLLQSANDAGGYDNCTVILVDNTEVKA